jgi:hypothetical protein
MVEVSIKRDAYLRMLDRHRPFWAAMHEFVYANRVKSIIEAGCGVAELCESVDSYTGIDMNSQVLEDNESFYGKGCWLDENFLEMDFNGRCQAEMFLSASLIEHCESFEPFLEKVLSLQLEYAVITFHKGLRDKEKIRHQRTDHRFFDNFYCRADVVKWLTYNVTEHWRIFTLPVSRQLKDRWDSVLVIDWTGKANLEMWEKRNVS